MSITYLTGDATRPAGNRPAMIAHVCNDVGAWGAGFTRAVSRRWPGVEQRFRQERPPLGALLFDQVGTGLWVAGMVAQQGLPSRGNRHVVRYDVLSGCLDRVAGAAYVIGADVHMPRIGCGLGGGTWDDVEPIVRRAFEWPGGGVDAFVYDLPRAAR